MDRKLVVAVALCILLAGCSNLDAGDSPSVETSSPGTNETQTATPASTDTSTPTRTPTPTPTPTPEPEVDPANPYGEENLTVYVDQSRAERDMNASVNRALDYWEENSSEYAGYNISYRVVENIYDSDVIITFEQIDSCGIDGHEETVYYGCADLVEGDAPSQVEASVDPNLTLEETNITLKHELGHTLGLTHDDDPQRIMSEYSAYPVEQEPMRVYLSAESGNPTTAFEREAEDALEYFEEHEDLNEDEQISWEFVDNRDRAHLILNQDQRGGVCEMDGAGSCFADGDFRDQWQIHLDNLDAEVYGWHIASLLGGAIFEELPEELQPDADRDTRETGWKY